MVFLSFFNTNLAFFALGAYKLKFSGYAYDVITFLDRTSGQATVQANTP